MSTNDVSLEDTDMAECEGEKVVTMMDVLQEQQEFEEDANAVLGASDDKNCTYSKGYIKRQAIYACLTCCDEAKEDPTKRAGVCLACSLTCHENHDLIELYTKRNFRCDCGNPKVNHPCQYTPNKTNLNDENKYNQNFSGLYCICHRPYPDPEGVEEDMIQCIICEDWLHASHLEATVPSSEVYAEMICKACMEKNEFLHDYSKYAVNGNIAVDANEIESSVVSNGDTKANGVDEAVKGEGKDLEVASQSKELKDDEVLSEIKEESQVTNATEVMSNDEKKAEKLTEPKHPVLETNVDETLKDLSEVENNVADEIAVDKDFRNEQNSTSETAAENYEDAPDISKDTLKDLSEAESNVAVEIAVNKDFCNEQNSTSIAARENDTEAPEISKDTLKDLSEAENNVADEIAVDNDFNNKQNSTSVAAAENVKNASETSTESQTQTADNDDNSANVNAEGIADVNTKDNNETNTEQTQDESLSDAQRETVTENDTDATGDTAGGNKESDEIVPKTKTETETINKETEISKMETETSLIERETSEIEIETNLENPGTKSKEEPVDNEEKQTDSSQPNEDCSADVEIELSKSSNTTENNASSEAPSTEDQTLEKKRKLSINKTDDISVKKPKLEETCIRPKNQKKVFKGATFWPSHFREKLCTCNECITMYKDLSVLFLTDPEDTVSAYEALGKERTDGTASTQYEKGLEALSSLGRIQQINALTEYNKMRDKLLDFLKSFKDRREVVKEEDIKAFFAGMKPKREPDGVYFCR